MSAAPPDQLLHLVFGGELESLEGVRFKDLDGLDVDYEVGAIPIFAACALGWAGGGNGD